MEGSSFRFIFFGEGYTEDQDLTEGKPNGKIRTVVKGPGMHINISLKLMYMKSYICIFLISLFCVWCFPEAGYVATPIAMVQAAITMLNESDSLPKTWVLPTYPVTVMYLQN